jgi:putative transcriptional regulator
MARALTEGIVQEVRMTKKKRTSRLTKELLETADDMRRVGLLTPVAHEKITMRHLRAVTPPGEVANELPV